MPAPPAAVAAGPGASRCVWRRRWRPGTGKVGAGGAVGGGGGEGVGVGWGGVGGVGWGGVGLGRGF